MIEIIIDRQSNSQMWVALIFEKNGINERRKYIMRKNEI